MAQEHQIMSMEGRIDRLEHSVDRLVESQREQTAEMHNHTAAVKVLCEKLETSAENGKKALGKVEELMIKVNTLETKDSERIRNEKAHFVGTLVLAAAALGGALRAFGVI